MKSLWLRFLCRYYYRYRIYYAIKDFVNNSPAQYRYIRFYELGNGVALFTLKINKRYSSQRAEIIIEKLNGEEWSLRYSYKQVNARLWRDIFDLNIPHHQLQASKNHFWRYWG